jgi:outer membrane protein TolC
MKPARTAPLIVILAGALAAQQVPLTLDRAVEQSVAKYPAVRGSLEQVEAATARIELARTSFLPRADFLAQENRASHNNVFGLLLQQPVISPISGPVLGTNSLGNVWGSALGVLVAWEPFDFGLRRANVEIAQSARDRAGAQVNVTKLQVASAAADAFLTILAAEQTVKAAQAGVDRANSLNTIVEALVKAELRAGAEASRSHAELALAKTQLVQAERTVDLARVALAQLLGIAPDSFTLDPGKLVAQLPATPPAPLTNVAMHPLLFSQQKAIEEVKAREKALDRSYFPKFNFEATSYARGTGIQPNGHTGGAFSGFGPNIQNWGVGMSVTFAAMDLASIRARKQIETHTERAETARMEQIAQDLNTELLKANATLKAARRIAENTPVQLQAARDAEQQATVRYKAGLTNIVEVAEAQRLLTQSEIDDSLAKLGIWRSLLGVAIAAGDLQPLLEQVAK